MVARFADRKSLVLAYADLRKFGIPEESIAAQFYESDNAQRSSADHQSFLKRLYDWMREHQSGKSLRWPAGDSPSSEYFRAGGFLQIEASGRRSGVISVVIHHDGELVG